MRGISSVLSLLRGQWDEPAAIERRRDRALAALVLHAYRTVPYWRRLLDEAGVAPGDVRGAADLGRIPVTRRQDLQSLDPEETISRGAEASRLIRTRTSGSTGIPLEVAGTRRDRSLVGPTWVRAWSAWGLRPWHRTAHFAARPPSARSWYERFGVLPRLTLSSGESPGAWIEAVRRWRPHLLQGYTLTLKLFAEAVLAEGAEDIRVPLVVNTSGLLDRSGRVLLERALGGRVADVYACEEAASVIAWECPDCRAYHVSADTVVAEILKDGRPAVPGEEGEIVITSLGNRSMPFIRYAVGDLARASAGSPRCGRGLPLWDEVIGRAGDLVILPDGRRLTPHPFFLVLDEAAGVGEWRLVQESLREIVVEVTPGRGFGGDTPGMIRGALSRIVGQQAEIRVVTRERIEREPSRKLRSVVSKVAAPPFGGAVFDNQASSSKITERTPQP